MIQMIERAMDHPGFSAIECLSECVEFYPGAFDPANPRKGGAFELIQERKWDNTPEDELRHDVTTSSLLTKWRSCPSPVSSASFTKPIALPKTPWKKDGSIAAAKNWAALT